MLEVFDKADTNLACARRNRSTIAPQALILMNSSFVLNEIETVRGACGTRSGPGCGEAD